MPYTPIILTEDRDPDDIRAYLGVDLGLKSRDFPDAALKIEGMLGDAELEITHRLAEQTQLNGVPTVAQIIAGSGQATPADKANLRNAVKFLVAAMFCNGATNAIDVSITDRNQTKDRGGIGIQWKDQQTNAEQDCDRALKRLTNWSDYLSLP